VPLPWSGEEPPFGFSPPGASAEPWLPQPAGWREVTAEREEGDPASTLELYRTALRIRRRQPGLGDGTLAWEEGTPAGVLSFTREPGFRCVVNLSAEVVALPPGEEVLLTSAPLTPDGALEPDAAAWLATQTSERD
jgi:alpha-glucosidase